MWTLRYARAVSASCRNGVDIPHLRCQPLGPIASVPDVRVATGPEGLPSI